MKTLVLYKSFSVAINKPLMKTFSGVKKFMCYWLMREKHRQIFGLRLFGFQLYKYYIMTSLHHFNFNFFCSVLHHSAMALWCSKFFFAALSEILFSAQHCVSTKGLSPSTCLVSFSWIELHIVHRRIYVYLSVGKCFSNFFKLLSNIEEKVFCP